MLFHVLLVLGISRAVIRGIDSHYLAIKWAMDSIASSLTFSSWPGEKAWAEND